MYAQLLGMVADDVQEGGACWAVLRHHAHEPDGQAVPLRFMAAVHRLVLRRMAPALALHYPSVGGTAPPTAAWPAFRRTVAEHVDLLAALTALPCQTNEVGRSAALAPALLWVQRTLGQPLTHYEIGASAGLNLRWDRFRYGTADGSTTWGDPASPVDLTGHWVVPPTDLPVAAHVVGRRGCDPNPLDPADPAAREGLTASVWADQHDRHQRLRGALQLAAAVPAPVDRAPAGSWLPPRLADRPAGVTAVTHSVVWRYLSEGERLQVSSALADHGGEATPDRAIAWIRLEPVPPATTYDGTPYPVTVTTWPGGITTVVGRAQAHGQEVTWTR